MKINLLNDYRGVLTDEIYYLAGEHDLPDEQAKALLEAGRAKPVLVKPKPARRASRKRKTVKK